LEVNNVREKAGGRSKVIRRRGCVFVRFLVGWKEWGRKMGLGVFLLSRGKTARWESRVTTIQARAKHRGKCCDKLPEREVFASLR